MRPRVWVLIVAVVLAIALGFTGRATDVRAFDVIAGLAWIVAIIVAVSLLPFWSRIIPKVEPMPGLFRRPGEGERWCVECGSPAARTAACEVCGGEPKLPKQRAPKAPKQPKKAGKKVA